MNTLENYYKLEIEKITVMMNRLGSFKQLLEEERNVSEQIIKAHEVMNSFQNDSGMNVLDVSNNNYLL